MLAIQMVCWLALLGLKRLNTCQLSTIRAVHEKNFVHRDIKPDNFVFGRSELDSSIYAVDFGMAKAYRDAEKKHITYRESRPLAGTARYMSINTHLAGNNLEEMTSRPLDMYYCTSYTAASRGKASRLRRIRRRMRRLAERSRRRLLRGSARDSANLAPISDASAISDSKTRQTTTLAETVFGCVERVREILL